MHEHGLMTRLIERARAECRARGGELRVVSVRLGALATSDEAHFRHEFEHVCEELGLPAVRLELELDPDRPTGVELVSVDGTCDG